MREIAQGMVELCNEWFFVITDEYGMWRMETPCSSITIPGCYENLADFVSKLPKQFTQ